MQMMAELCLYFACEGRAYEAVLRRVPEEAVEYPVTSRYPTSVEAGRFLARKAMRSAALRIASRGRIGKWFVGVRPNTGRSIAESGGDRLDGFREIRVPRGSLEMADPFLLEHGGRTWLLFEDVKLGGRKGRLACMEVSESGSLLRDGSASGVRQPPVVPLRRAGRRGTVPGAGVCRRRARRISTGSARFPPGWSWCPRSTTGPARRHDPFSSRRPLVLLRHDHDSRTWKRCSSLPPGWTVRGHGIPRARSRVPCEAAARPATCSGKAADCSARRKTAPSATGTR